MLIDSTIVSESIFINLFIVVIITFTWFQKKGNYTAGIPPVMGGHLMASGTIAPHSMSKGAGDGVPHQFNYDAGDTDARVLTFSDKDALSVGLAKVVLRQYEAAVKSHGVFTIVLSGGSLTKMLPCIMKNAS